MIAGTRVALHCPWCGAPVKEAAQSLTCPGCAASFDVIDGIPCLAQDRSYYYGEVDRARMTELVRACQKEAWFAAFDEILQQVPYPSDLLDYAVGEHRAGWWPLLSLRPNWRVLDLGCGWGAITFALAPRVSSVVACDLAIERLRFLQIRAAQEGFSNIEMVWGGDTPRLPFASGSFDLVVMNGVLEWVPVSHPGSPRELQARFLRETSRILTPGGQLMLGIENRWSWLYFLGAPEDHIRIRYVSLLPRRLADLYAKARIGKPYRNHTYSYRGYKKLLREAGFQSNHGFIPLPNYRSFEEMVDAERPGGVAGFFADRGWPRLESLQLRAKASVARFLCPAFCWVANRGPRHTSFAEELGEEVARRLGEPEGGFQWSRFRITPAGLSVISGAWRSGRDPVVIKLPSNPLVSARCRAERETLLSLGTVLAGDNTPWPEIPIPLLQGEFRGADYFVEDAKPGFSGMRFQRSRRALRQLRALALDFLVRLHRATVEPVCLNQAVWEDTAAKALRPGLQSIEKNTGISADSVTDYLVSQLCERTWPLALCHGDFWAANLLFDRRCERLTGVIDWDSSRLHFFPLIDLLHFIIYGLAGAERRRVPDVVGEAIQRGHLPGSGQQSLEEYLSALRIEMAVTHYRAFLVLYWVFYVAERVGGRHTKLHGEREWLRQNVEPAVTWLKEVLQPNR